MSEGAPTLHKISSGANWVLAKPQGICSEGRREDSGKFFKKRWVPKPAEAESIVALAETTSEAL